MEYEIDLRGIKVRLEVERKRIEGRVVLLPGVRTEAVRVKARLGGIFR